MNNTLTAKEWLEKEELYSCSKEYRNKIELAAEEVDMFIYMEKYANYKNRILEYRIKEFGKVIRKRITLLSDSSDWETGYEKDVLENLIEQYNKQFNIENKQ